MVIFNGAAAAGTSEGIRFRSSRRYMPLVAGVLLTVLSQIQAGAAIISAASPSLSDVSAAIALASDGDTVIIPAGTATWSSTLTITKGITLQGQTTTDVVNGTANDQTIITVGTGTNGNQALIQLTTSGSSLYRVTGITFRTGQTTTTNYNGMIKIVGTGTAVRIDHCDFDRLAHEGDVIAADGPLGVIDHNRFYNTSDPGFCFYFTAPSWNGDAGSWGDETFAESAYYGQNKFMFAEDNYINNQSGIYRGVCDAEMGGRFVFRHNHVYNQGIGTHGDETGRHRGVRAIEVYGNDFHWDFSVAATGGIRSGSILIHDNTHHGVNPVGMSIGTFRMFNDAPGNSFLPSTGNNVWDYNVTESNGTHIDGHPSYLFDSGTATGGSTTTLVDTSKNWTTNRWAGYTVIPTGGKTLMLILSNTSNTLTGVAAISGGINWKSGNTYQIYRVLVSMDQACRGVGDLIVNQTPVNNTTGTATWIHQALEPCYTWNEIYTSSTGQQTMLPLFPTNGTDAVLHQNRDYYNQNASFNGTSGVGVGTLANRPSTCTAGTDVAGGANTPGVGYWATDQNTLYVCTATNTWTAYYTPYIYPHPLVSGTPAPPQNLHTVP